jgi:adenylate cyclase
MNRFAIQLVAGLLVTLMMIFAYHQNYMQTFDDRIRDFMFVIRGPIVPTGQVVIVDIDEKSLGELGQWPWERNKLAQIMQNLADAGAGVVGLDIVFAEDDKTSPKQYLKRLGIDSSGYPDYDEVFGQAIATLPVVPGFIFEMENDGRAIGEAPSGAGTYSEKYKRGEEEFLLEPYRATTNVPKIQDFAYSSAFFNTIPGEDSIIRSVPLAMKYDFSVYPSLAFEMVRIGLQTKYVYINYHSDDETTNAVDYIRLGKRNIPTDDKGRLFVNFRGPGKTFKYISASDIYNNTFDKHEVLGKYLLMGTSAAGLLDLRATPYDSIFPGVEVHANVIDNILAGDIIAKPYAMVTYETFLIFGLGILLTIILALASAVVSLVIASGFFIGYLLFNYYMLFEQGLVFNILFVSLGIILNFILAIVVNYFLETRQKNMIKGKFASKVSPAVMEDILKHEGGNGVMAGMSREVTVFFSDVRGFTNISEASPDPKTLIEFLNEYMDPMTDIVIEQEGTVDKFIGDAIMAYWNAPIDVEGHPDKAVIASLQQLHALRALNVKLKADERFKDVVQMSEENGVEPVDIGIGLNTGIAIVGEMGSSGRSDYTVIGDPINLGARLESLCKFYNSKLNISNFTKEKLTGDYIYRFLDLVTVKGKKEPIEIWQIHDYDKEMDETIYDVSREQLDKELTLYHQGIALYKEAKFEEALAIFKDIDSWEEKSNKNVYAMYIERCEHYIEEPPVDFNGVFVHTTKG